MKKLSFLFLTFFACTLAFSYSPKRDFAYTIIFSGDFKNDLISLTLNKKKILNQYRVDNSDVVTRGHLSLTQYEKDIKISYNGKEIFKPGISVAHSLELFITIDGKREVINVDLRKGKILLVDYDKNVNKANEGKKAIIEQLEEPYILI